MGTYSPFKATRGGLRSGASLKLGCPADSEYRKLSNLPFFAEGGEKKNVAAYGEPLLSKDREAVMPCMG